MSDYNLEAFKDLIISKCDKHKDRAVIENAFLQSYAALEAANKKIKELESEGLGLFRLSCYQDEKIESLESKLKIATDALEFYGKLTSHSTKARETLRQIKDA